MTDLQWGLLQPVDVGAQVQQGFAAGQAMVKQVQSQNALRAYAANPSDPAAYRRLLSLDPTSAMKLREDDDRHTEVARKNEARSALGDLITAGPSVGALNGYGPSASGSVATARTIDPEAIIKAAKADPESFLTIQGKRLDIDKKQLEKVRDLNTSAMQLLGSVSDQPSYDAARAQATKLYAGFGQDIAELNLPEEYSPETVDGLRMRGMNTLQQIQSIARENKLDWDIEDDQIDNLRSDRQVASVDAHRHGQLANARRGQDLADSRGRRGQALADTRGRRGQDLTDRRTRDSASFRGKPGKGKGGGDGDGPVAVGPNGHKIVVRNGKWVDAETGKPVS